MDQMEKTMLLAGMERAALLVHVAMRSTMLLRICLVLQRVGVVADGVGRAAAKQHRLSRAGRCKKMSTIAKGFPGLLEPGRPFLPDVNVGWLLAATVAADDPLMRKKIEE